MFLNFINFNINSCIFLVSDSLVFVTYNYYLNKKYKQKMWLQSFT